ncbi:hypothetical protein B0A55_08908 [Friedmanniomyces simplex]|uniref:gamma-glutamylcyclotransferase n=1 Tax=Friedmanniomyces simplex TaxID=329884 RepID=A0A4U0WZG0_9PEZI|nr:hypothetical protein B0A55_08908 [Friedmanniomyces simplex]
MEPSSSTAAAPPDRALAAAFSIQQVFRKMTKSTPSHDSTFATASPTPSAGAEPSSERNPHDPHDHLKRSELERGTVLYLAYGSNLSNETFRGNRGIKPLSQVNVQVPSLRMTFDLPGIPYAEPCFANSGARDARNDPLHNSPAVDLHNEKTPLLKQDKEKEGYRKDQWHKGLIGVVYEVTQEDYTHIIATEGGGASYHDVLVDCHPFVTADPKAPVPQYPTLPAFKAHTLFAPAAPPGQPPKHGGRFQRSDPAYAQPSARYLKLITDGAAELGLPLEYQDYLHAIRPYTITTGKQRVGQYVFLTLWLPIVSFIFLTGKMFQDENGRLPPWMVELSGAIFKGVWASYDSFFEPMFGDGERSIPDGGDDVAGGDEVARKTGAKMSYQSRTLIDVSQDAQSPINSSPGADKSLVTGANGERIEDSLNEHLRANAGGPVRPPQQPADDDDDDELYGLSPQGKASIDAAKLSKKAREGSAERPLNTITENHRHTTRAVERTAQKAAVGNAFEDIRANGATTRESQIDKQRSRATTRREPSDSRSAQAAVTNRVESERPRTKPPEQQPSRTQQSKKPPTAAELHAKSAPASQRAPMASAGTSAMAVLRAKREGLPVARASAASVEASRSRTPAAGPAPGRSPKRPPLKERSKNVPTPAKSRLEAATAAQRPTDGKPKSLKLGMFAQTPVAGREKITQTTQKRKAGKATGHEDEDEDAAHEPGTLKQPARLTKPGVSAVTRNPSSDMPESSPPRAKIPTLSKRPGTAKKAGTSKAARAKNGKEDKHVEKPRKGRPRKSAKLPDSDEISEPTEVRKQPARQAKVLNGAAKARDTGGEETGRQTIAKAHSVGATETIEDFEHAVVNFDDHAKTAAEEPDDHPVPATLAVVKPSGTERQHAPQTPALFHSSPPLEEQGEEPQFPTGLVDPAESRRVTIISFDRSGPRNQGTRSAKKSAVGSARTDRTAARRQKGRSSAATSTRSYRVDRAAPPNNVAEDIGDALAGFLKKPASLSIKPTAPKNAQREPVRAQGSLPPLPSPQRLPVDDADDSWTQAEDAAGESTVETYVVVPAVSAKTSTKPYADRTASQNAMPPPASKAGRVVKADQAPTVPATFGLAAVERVTAADEEGRKAVVNSGVKRPRENDGFTQPATKKSKDTTLETLHTGPSADQSVAVTQGKVTFPEHIPTRGTEPIKRAVRKISRRASQGVDIHGSPIPKDMVVPENATTLETYTQQAGLSSDIPVPASDAAAHRTAAESLTNPTFFKDILAVPAHQPEILSSNEKRRPASPREDSQAFTDIVLGKVNPKQLVIRDEGAAPATDPFSSSQDLRKVPTGKSSSSLFSEELRTRAEQIAKKRRSAALADEEEDPDKTLVEPEPAPKRSKANAAPKRHRAVYANEEDLSDTLVEPEPRPKRPKGNAAHSRKGAGELSEADKDDSADMPAISLWRDALRPHQLNLFDELVAVSHRLVRHLVDHETAMHEAVHDYQRRGLNMIEQAELARAQEYGQSLQKLEREKKAAKHSLQQQSERMRSAMEDIQQRKAERSKIDGKLDREELKLKEMLAQLGGA